MTRWIWITAIICALLGFFISPWLFAAAAILAIVAAISGIEKHPEKTQDRKPTRIDGHLEKCPRCGTAAVLVDRVPDVWTHPGERNIWRKRVCAGCFRQLKRRKYHGQAPEQDEAWKMANKHRTRPTGLTLNEWICPDCGFTYQASEFVDISIPKVKWFKQHGVPRMRFAAVCNNCYQRAMALANKK